MLKEHGAAAVLLLLLGRPVGQQLTATAQRLANAALDGGHVISQDKACRYVDPRHCESNCVHLKARITENRGVLY